MVDTPRTLAALQALLADNVAGDISAQDLRDFLVSVGLVTGSGELEGTADAPTVTSVHAGSAHHNTHDADDVAYIPTTLADWDAAADPGDVEQALDQLAERTTDLEGSAGHAEDHDHDGSPTQKLLAANTHETPSPDTHHPQSHGNGDHTTAFTDDTTVNAHIADAAAAHAASAISIADAGNDFTATDVEGALDELQADNEAHVAAADPHAGYVLESLIDAAGDLYKGSADNTVAKLSAPTTWKFLGSAGVSYNDAVETGVYASRPAASAANVGRLYMATDRQNTLYRCFDATTWEIVNPRRMTLGWYIDGRPRYAPTARIGRLWRLPADLGPWKPIRAMAHVVTAPSEGANATGTATAGSTTTLTDSGKAWTVNQWSGAVCTISAGAQSGKSARVASNTATVLTFADAFSGALDNTSVYALVSGIRIQFETGATDTPSTNLFTEPASDATTENRLRIAPAAVAGTSSTFSDTSFAADDRVECLIDCVGALPASEGLDLSITLEIEQAEG